LNRHAIVGPAAALALLCSMTAVGLRAQEKQPSPAVTAGKALKLSGTTQLYGIYQDPGVDSFAARRVRITLGGDVVKNLRFKVMAEMAKTPTLLDAFGEFEPSASLGVRFGQFLVPFSLESLTSVSDMDTVNRALATEKLAPGRDIGTQGRDVGVAVYGKASIFEYTAGLLNGSGTNKADMNEHKDLAGRFLVRPTGGVALGVSLYRGRQSATAEAPLVVRDREGVELAVARGPATLRAEYVHAKDGAFSRSGGYVQAGWVLLKDKLQAVLKFDTLDLDRSRAGGRTDVWTAGLNWYIQGKNKLQVNYERRRPETGDGTVNALLAQFQINF
jgi:phosphate-selective porin